MGADARIYAFPAHRMRPDREPLLKKAEVARELRVSERWVELRMRDAGFPFIKDAHSRLVYYKWSEIETWMARRTTA
jgi:predicted DNA-binding transcriptional regulator AlpA